MEHAQDFDDIASYTIDDEIRKPGDKKLPCAPNVASPSRLRKTFEVLC
jgi:hypothetical protein